MRSSWQCDPKTKTFSVAVDPGKLHSGQASLVVMTRGPCRGQQLQAWSGETVVTVRIFSVAASQSEVLDQDLAPQHHRDRGDLPEVSHPPLPLSAVCEPPIPHFLQETLTPIPSPCSIQGLLWGPGAEGCWVPSPSCHLRPETTLLTWAWL